MITEYGHAWDPDDAAVNLSSGPIRVLNDGVIDESVELRPVGFNSITTALIRGDITPPPRRLQIRHRGIWWHWECPCCPEHIGGYCEEWDHAIACAIDHASIHERRR